MRRREFVSALGGGSLTARNLLRSGGAPNDASTKILLPNLPCAVPLPEVVLFSFDNWAFPFQSYLENRLIPGEKLSLVLRHGPPGSHDELLFYYGTVIRIENTFHMWYSGNYGPVRDPSFYALKNYVVCYARSKDGVSWEKPSLGLVEHNGSTNNNICALDEPTLVCSALVLYDPEDPHPNRRFKIAYEASFPNLAGGRLCVAFSPDGLHWKRSPKNPVGPYLEMSGVTKFRGLYYVNGQVDDYAHSWVPARRLETLVSEDFEHWSPCSALGLDRTTDITGPSTTTRGQGNEGEQIHQAAGLWDRGNVLIGIYGQWHGHYSEDLRLAVVDLGLAVSYDALHFFEPIRGFPLIQAEEQPESTKGVFPQLMQGQGMENFGDQTLYWYSLYPLTTPNGLGTENSGVHMVTWQRDRLGMLRPFLPASRSQRGLSGPRAISCPIQLTNAGAKLFINASGLGEYSYLRVGLLTEGFRSLPGFSEADAAVIGQSGLRTPVRWKGGEVLPAFAEPFRIDIRFEGVRPEDAALHAAYVTAA